MCFPHADRKIERSGVVIHIITQGISCHVDNLSTAYFPTCGGREKFLPFAQGSEILPARRSDCFWLIDGQALQEPSVFLPGKVPYIGRIPGPLEAPIIQAFIVEAEAIFFKVQCFYPVAAPSAKKKQGIAIGIQLVSIPDNCHQAIDTLAHVSISCYQKEFRYAGQFT